MYDLILMQILCDNGLLNSFVNSLEYDLKQSNTKSTGRFSLIFELLSKLMNFESETYVNFIQPSLIDIGIQSWPILSKSPIKYFSTFLYNFISCSSSSVCSEIIERYPTFINSLLCSLCDQEFCNQTTVLLLILIDVFLEHTQDDEQWNAILNDPNIQNLETLAESSNANIKHQAQAVINLHFTSKAEQEF